MSAQSDTPIKPVAVIRTPRSLHLDMPHDGRLSMFEQGYRLSVECGAKAPMLSTVCSPVTVNDPVAGFMRMTTTCPSPQLLKDEMVEFLKTGFADHGCIIVCPASNARIQLSNQGRLRGGSMGLDDATERVTLLFQLRGAGFDERLKTKWLRMLASGARFATLIFANVELPNLHPQKIKAHSSLIGVEGRRDMSFAWFQG